AAQAAKAEANRQRDAAQAAARAERVAREEEARQKAVAVHQTQQALIRESALLADRSQQETRGGNAVNGMLLALQALPRHFHPPDRPVVPDAWSSLHSGLMAQRERAVLSGHTGPVRAVSVSPDGASVVTASDDGTTRIWRSDGQGGSKILG